MFHESGKVLTFTLGLDNLASLHGGAKISPKMHPKDMFFRVDHQTFRKLPRTKGIVFGVHPIMKKLEDLKDSPLVPALLSKVHLEGERKLMKVSFVFFATWMVTVAETKKLISNHHF